MLLVQHCIQHGDGEAMGQGLMEGAKVQMHISVTATMAQMNPVQIDTAEVPGSANSGRERTAPTFTSVGRPRYGEI